MKKWIVLIVLFVISAFLVGFAELDIVTEAILRSVYFTCTLLLAASLIARDMRRKSIE